MKAQDVIYKLWEQLPRHISNFSTVRNPTVASVSGKTVSVTLANHGLVSGENRLASVTNSVLLNPVSGIEQTSEGVVFTTTERSIIDRDTKTVKLSSVINPSLDGDYELINSTLSTFTIKEFADIAATDVILHEERNPGINGVFDVTVIDQDNFSYDVQYAVGDGFSIELDTMNINTDLRIGGAVSLDVARGLYTKQESKECWLFCVPGNASLDTDTSSGLDNPAGISRNAASRLKLAENFAVFLFMPIRTSNGTEEVDLGKDIRTALYKSIVGVSFDSGFSSGSDNDSACVPISDQMIEAKGKLYIHQFVFSQVPEITQQDTGHNIETAHTFPMGNLQLDIENQHIDNNDVIAQILQTLNTK